MTYISCSHPRSKVKVKEEVIKSIDILTTRTVPKPYCTSCNSYLPLPEADTQEVINFWFARQDGIVQAFITA